MVTLITAGTAMVAALLYSGAIQSAVVWIMENFQWEDTKTKK